MRVLTQRQQEILDFILRQEETGQSPTYREIARHFGLSVSASADHIRALKKKGAISTTTRKARSLRARTSALKSSEKIPLLGSIPAGLAAIKNEEVEGFIFLRTDDLGFKADSHTFALRVTGESMIDRHIMPGDVVILQRGVEPQPNDVVAALIDQESTLKTFVIKNGNTFLKAENARYPNLIPTEELLIQGVVKYLLRRDV